MTEQPSDAEREQTRHVAREVITNLSEMQKRVLEEHSAMGRWLTASLLAVNGAGALAVANAGAKFQHAQADGAPFVAGVMAALFSAVLNQKANQRASRVVGEVIGHAVVVAHTGEMNEAAEQVQKDFQSNVLKGARWPALAGWVSAMLFAAGAIGIGMDGPKADPANDSRCAVVQHDMLLKHPRSAAGPTIFQALGCKPQGEELPFQH